MRPLFLLSVVFTIAAANVACDVVNPCIALAERICACESTQAQQQACRTDRINAQQDTLVVSSSEAEVCTAALDTCTCDAIETNRVELCGYTREGPPVEDEPPPFDFGSVFPANG